MDTSDRGDQHRCGDLDAVLQRLVARGDLQASQAELILAETGSPPAGSTDQERGRVSGFVGPLAEAAGYTGGVLAAAAGIALGSQFWDRLEPWAQVAVLALVAVVLWFAGHVVTDTRPRSDGRRAEADTGPGGRLTGTLWLASTAATAAACGSAAHDLLGMRAETLTLVIGLATLVHGLVLWRARQGALQLLAPYVGALLTVFAALEHLPTPPHDYYPAIGWAIGAAGIALAWGQVLRPARAAHVLGASIALVSAQILAFELGMAGSTTGLLLGLLTAVGLLLLARVVGQTALTGLGAAGLAVFVPQILEELFPGSLAAPTAMFLGGVAMLAAAIVAIRGRRDATPEVRGVRHGS